MPVPKLLTNWRVLGVALLVLLILAAALWPESVAVDLVAAGRGALQVTIDEEGETRVRERFVVSAPVSGRLQRIELEAGDPVTRGMILARLTPAQPVLLDARAQAELSAAVQAARAAVGQARAEQQRAAAELARARSQVARQRELATAGAISRDQLEAAEFSVTRAEFDLQMAQARLQQPGAGGRTIEIASPVDGVVLRRPRESETVVQPGEPLLEVGDPGQLEIVADLLSTDAVRVPQDARVLVEQWGGSRPLEGRVRRVEPSGFMKVSALGVEEQRVNVIIDFVGPAAAAQLGDGYRVEVRIVIWENPDVLKVPIGALFRQGTDWAVFTVSGGVAATRIVHIGERNAAEAQVLDGLEAGQPVVLHPPDTLADGVRVTQRPAS